MAAEDIQLAESAVLRAVRERTLARLFVGRSGAAYRTATQLQLRAAHASAVDAVRVELDRERDLGHTLIEQYGIFEVQTAAHNKAEYLRNPELGRRFNEAARATIRERCAPAADLQILVGDGLSVTAVAAQVPLLLPLIVRQASDYGWTVGQPFVVRYCRVGLMNELGDLLQPTVVVLLIGERPGLATAESLSAYMAFRPTAGHTDADRNLISNIHARGVPVEAAAGRIVNFAARLIELGRSGATVKEELPHRVDRALPANLNHG